MPRNRAVVTVAVGNRPDLGKPGEGAIVGKPFAGMLPRWEASFRQYGEGAHLKVFTELPPGSPEHLQVPYAFKVYAINTLRKDGYTSILWADAAVGAIRSLAPIWERTERDGYWFSNNWTWNCGQWTCDTALPLLGITREQAFEIPQVAATAFALDFGKDIAVKFFDEYSKGAVNGAFKGPWTNSHGEASPDRRVLGHRHDQTAASVIAWRLKMKFTIQPEFFSDYQGETDGAILKVER